jgi:hypothetical protein
MTLKPTSRIAASSDTTFEAKGVDYWATPGRDIECVGQEKPGTRTICGGVSDGRLLDIPDRFKSGSRFKTGRHGDRSSSLPQLVVIMASAS